MSGFFTRERFGWPQVWAALMLFAFFAQCLWLVEQGWRTGNVSAGEIYRLDRGIALWQRKGPPRDSSDQSREPEPFLEQLQDGSEDSGYDPSHSPLWYLVASAPLAMSPRPLRPENIRALHRLAAAPYLLFGVLLGASLWYVARRLFGNAGGYIALALYCFSPGMVRSSAIWSAEPEVGAAWGVFGAIFTAIAVAHTLYAPREVILWNWRRIGLLGLSLALAVGSLFPLIVVLPVALGFMLYLAPARRPAAVAIWAVACGIGGLLLYASYFFHPREFWRGLGHASFSGLSWRAFTMARAYRQVLAQLGQSSPALVLALPVALVAYLLWRRARYFGNTAPLLVAGLFLVLASGTPHFRGLGFQLMALPFLFVFVAGVAADLLETGYRPLAQAAIWALLVANAAWHVWELVRAGRG